MRITLVVLHFFIPIFLFAQIQLEVQSVTTNARRSTSGDPVGGINI